MQNVISKFNGLNGGVAVSREKLLKIRAQAEKEGVYEIVTRIDNLLNSYPDAISFELEVVAPVKEVTGLGGLSVSDFQFLDYEEASENEEASGLNKAVSPNDIYQMITDKIMDQIKTASKKDYVKKWKTKGYLIAYNFESKKAYNGVNQIVLGGFFGPIDNPYYLTFKQVQELGGTIKKGSQGHEVIYYTKYEKEVTKKVKDEFGKETGETKEVTESFYAVRYYNVFNGSDIDGIDFDLDNFPLRGKLENEIITTGNNQPIEAAELIIKNYPKPQPTIKHGGNRAYFDLEADLIQLPDFQSFETSQDYYRTTLHELSHSTMLPNRLNRNPDISIRKEYAFEELVAEFGAVFLSSQAGIMFYTNKNHAAYLKGWNEALTQMENDNRFFIKASAAAQKIADYILQFDEAGNALYLKNHSKIKEKKTASDYGKKTKFVPKPKVEKSEYPFSKDDIPYETAYRAHTGTSFSPEKRAEGEKKRYFEILKETYDEFLPKAKKIGKEVEFHSMFTRYQTGFLNRFLKYLNSRHGFYSTMIAGGSNFPVARMNKKSTTIDSNMNEYMNWINTGDKKFRELVTPEIDKPIKSGSENALSLLKEKLSNYENAQKKAVAANKALRSIMKKNSDFDTILSLYKEALTDIGFSEKMVKSVTELGERERQTHWLGLNTINTGAEIRRLKERIATEEKINAKKQDTNAETNFQFDGGSVELDYNENRVKIYFDSIPEPELRNKLKGAGYAFKWSPKNKAWQRQLNTFRLYLLEAVLPNLSFKKNNGLNSPNFENVTIDENQEVIILDAQEPVKPVQNTPTVNHVPVVVHSVETERHLKAVKNSVNHVHLELNKPAQIIYEVSPKHKSLNYLMNNDEVNVLYDIPGDVGRFLGDVEIKPKESVAITLSSPQGGGKTRGILQFANAFAYNYRVKIFSLEEHVESKLFKDKIAEYIDPGNFERISVESELPNGINTIHESISDFDVIMVDSWSKMLEIDSRLNLDQDFRKKYDGKLFVFIFQQTSDGKMYGGAKNQFDGDIILFVEKFPDYRLSYIYPNKNRYTSTPLDQLKYNVYTQSLMQDENTEAEPTEVLEL